MTRRYSKDFKLEVVNAVNNGLPKAVAAKKYQVSEESVRLWTKTIRTPYSAIVVASTPIQISTLKRQKTILSKDVAGLEAKNAYLTAEVSKLREKLETLGTLLQLLVEGCK